MKGDSETKSLIRKKRIELGLSTTQLAHRLGVVQSTVVRLEGSEERGAITLGSLRKAADALNCELNYRLVDKSGRKRGGRRRKSASLKRRRPSRVAGELLGDNRRAASKLTAEQRLRRALELSDFMRKVTLCSKEP